MHHSATRLGGRIIRACARLGLGLGAGLGVALAAAVPGTVPQGYTAPKAAVQAKATTNALAAFFSATGRVYLSVDGSGTNAAAGAPIQIEKRRDGSKLRRAFLMAASTGFSKYAPVDGEVSLDGVPVDFDESTLVASSIDSFNLRADVTEQLRATVDAAPAGRVTLNLVELVPSRIDGEVLAVVFDDPAEAEGTVSLFYGAQSTTGDSFNILLAEPIVKADTGKQLFFSLGISFGFQTASTLVQFSLVDVNGVRLTSSAGGFDDGLNANGALITVGGLDDLPDNPVPTDGPNGCGNVPRCDDELYDLKAVLADGTTTIQVDTRNPSNDDNIFFAAIQSVGIAALVGEGVLLSPSEASVVVGNAHEVLATVQDDDGQPVAGRPVTFTVSGGPNNGLSTTLPTDANGLALLQLTASAEGTDSVTASIVDSNGDPQSSNVASVTWLPPARVQFSTEAYRVNEDAGNAAITLTRTGDTSGSVSVQFITADGSAQNGLDYSGQNQVVVFAPGETSKTVQVPIIDDTRVEGDETVLLTLTEELFQPKALRSKSAVPSKALGSPASAVLTIVDNDVTLAPPPAVSFTTAQSATAEGAALDVTVTLSSAATSDIDVPLAVSGSAQSGADFDALPATVRFAAGATSAILRITVIDDALAEGVETIVLTLGATDKVTLGNTSVHTVSIAASDAVVTPPATSDVSARKTSGGGAINPLLLALMAPLALLRRRRLAAAAVLAACSGTAAADDALWYVGVQAGPAASAYGSTNLTRKLQDKGHDVTAGVDAHDFGASVYIGRKVETNTAFEIGLLYFGEYEAQISGAASDKDQLKSDLLDAYPLGGYGLSGAVRYDLALTQQLVLSPRLGAFVWASDNEVKFDDGSKASRTRRGAGGKFDLTLSYRFTPAFSLGLGSGVLVPSASGTIRQGYMQLEFAF